MAGFKNLSVSHKTKKAVVLWGTAQEYIRIFEKFASVIMEQLADNVQIKSISQILEIITEQVNIYYVQLFYFEIFIVPR